MDNRSAESSRDTSSAIVVGDRLRHLYVYQPFVLHILVATELWPFAGGPNFVSHASEGRPLRIHISSGNPIGLSPLAYRPLPDSAICIRVRAAANIPIASRSVDNLHSIISGEKEWISQRQPMNRGHSRSGLVVPHAEKFP